MKRGSREEFGLHDGCSPLQLKYSICNALGISRIELVTINVNDCIFRGVGRDMVLSKKCEIF